MMRKKRVGNIFNALKRDTGALLDRQRVVGRLKLNKRTFSAVAQMYVALESISAGIDCEFGAKPAEERPLVLPYVSVPQLRYALKACLGNRHPYAPDERILAAKNGYFQAASNKKKLLVVDDALIGAELTAAARRVRNLTATC